MKLKQYIDSTYLKTAKQANVSVGENKAVVLKTIEEAIAEEFKLVMVLPEEVRFAKEMILQAQSKVLVGTVIDFPKGVSDTTDKIAQARIAIKNGADELDFVLDYEAFCKGEIHSVKQQVLECTKFVLSQNKTIKWIIETAALNQLQIMQLCVLIKNVVIANFKESCYELVYVKSSTGFYTTFDGSSNGATSEAIKIMVENAFPLPIKVSGGIKSHEQALHYIKLGVKRIGTSAAKAIVHQQMSNTDY